MSVDRRLKPEFLYPRCGVTLAEATIIDIRDQGIGTVPRFVVEPLSSRPSTATCPLDAVDRAVAAPWSPPVPTIRSTVIYAATLVGMDQCPKLVTLYASQNKLKSLIGLESCPNLWRVDVSDNKVRRELCYRTRSA